MSCVSNLIKNVTLNCEASTGGASAVFLIPFEKVDKVATLAAQDNPANPIANLLVLPTIELKDPTDKFIRIDCPNGVINGTSNVTKNEVNRTSSHAQTAIFNLYSNEMSSETTDVDFYAFLASLTNGKFLAVLKLANGKGLTIGWNNGCTLTSKAFQTGVAGADLSGSVITLTASNETHDPYFVISDFFEEKTKFVADTI